MPLAPDPQSFTFRGATAPPEAGDYEVRVRIPGVPDGLIKASTAFTVASNPFGELGRLHCDELLLRQIAKDSGGEYYREEEMQRLVELPGPASDHREITEEIQLWQSYWWFAPHHAPPHHRMDPPPHERVGVMSSQLDPYIRTKLLAFRGRFRWLVFFARGELWIAGVAGGVLILSPADWLIVMDDHAMCLAGGCIS